MDPLLRTSAHSTSLLSESLSTPTTFQISSDRNLTRDLAHIVLSYGNTSAERQSLGSLGEGWRQLAISYATQELENVFQLIRSIEERLDPSKHLHIQNKLRQMIASRSSSTQPADLIRVEGILTDTLIQLTNVLSPLSTEELDAVGLHASNTQYPIVKLRTLIYLRRFLSSSSDGSSWEIDNVREVALNLGEEGADLTFHFVVNDLYQKIDALDRPSPPPAGGNSIERVSSRVLDAHERRSSLARQIRSTVSLVNAILNYLIKTNPVESIDLAGGLILKYLKPKNHSPSEYFEKELIREFRQVATEHLGNIILLKTRHGEQVNEYLLTYFFHDLRPSPPFPYDRLPDRLWVSSSTWSSIAKQIVTISFSLKETFPSTYEAFLSFFMNLPTNNVYGAQFKYEVLKIFQERSLVEPALSRAMAAYTLELYKGGMTGAAADAVKLIPDRTLRDQTFVDMFFLDMRIFPFSADTTSEFRRLLDSISDENIRRRAQKEMIQSARQHHQIAFLGNNLNTPFVVGDYDIQTSDRQIRKIQFQLNLITDQASIGFFNSPTSTTFTSIDPSRITVSQPAVIQRTRTNEIRDIIYPFTATFNQLTCYAKQTVIQNLACSNITDIRVGSDHRSITSFTIKIPALFRSIERSWLSCLSLYLCGCGQEFIEETVRIP